MCDQPEDAALVQAKTLPYAVAALNNTVERRNPRLVTMDEFAVDVQDEVTVPFIKRLKNDSPSSWKARKN